MHDRGMSIMKASEFLRQTGLQAALVAISLVCAGIVGAIGWHAAFPLQLVQVAAGIVGALCFATLLATRWR